MLADEPQINSLTDAESACDTHIQHSSSHEPRDARCSSALRWYVGEAEHHRLKMATDELSARGHEVFRPVALLAVRDRVHGKQAQTFTLALRPSMFQFFFLRLDIAAYGWPTRDRRIGFMGMLKSLSGTPRACLDGELDHLVAQSAADTEKASRPPRKLKPLESGSMPLVMRGAMAGKVGTVERCNGLNTVIWLPGFGGVFKHHLLREYLSDE